MRTRSIVSGLGILLLILIAVTDDGSTGRKVRKAQSSFILKSTIDSLLAIQSSSTDTAVSRIINERILKSTSFANYPEAIINSFDRLGVVYRDHSMYQEALAAHKKALFLAETTNNIFLKEKTLNNIGVVYRRLDNNQLALEFHIKALKLAEQIKDTRNICISINSIGNIYFSLTQYNKALSYFKKALDLEQKRENLLGVAINYNNIGLVYEATGKYDEALSYYQKSLDCNLRLKNKLGEAICYNAIGDYYSRKKDYKKASNYYTNALKINEVVGDKIYISGSYANIASTFLEKGDYEQAIALYKKGLDLALQIGSKWQAHIAYKGLSDSYLQLKNFKEALNFYKLSTQFSDSIVNENNIRQITHIQAQYDIDTKQQQIELLQKGKETSQLIALIVVIILTATMIIAAFGFRTLTQRRKITQQELDLKVQKIRELEKDRQLVAQQAVMQGEEKERSRLARDLHDGLGGLLSGVKLTLTNLKSNYILSRENVDQFNQALTLLDSSIKEMRRISHNMMPEALIKFGLKDALQDFVDRVGKDNNSQNISFRFFGEYKRLETTLETTLYRIAMELVNNAIKHSGAGEIGLQVIQESNRIHLSVYDNGKGFDINKLKDVKSAGLQNIRARVQSFKGRIDVDSVPGQGTEIGVEFKLTGTA